MTVPSGWREAALGDVCTVVSGATPKTGVTDYWDGDVRWLTPKDMSLDRSKTLYGGARNISQAGYASCSARVFPAGSVVVSSRAPVGYVAIAGEAMATNQGCKTAIPPADITSDYLYWYLRAAKPDFERRASGTTFRELSGKAFAATRLAWPSLEEQRRIVAILEDHLSRLDAADAYLAAAAQRSGVQRRAILEAETASLGSSVAAATVSQLCEHTLGKMLDSAKRTEGRPTQYIRNANVRWGTFDLSNLRAAPFTDAERSTLDVRDGDLFACEGGEPGRCAVWRGGANDFSFQKALHRLRVKDVHQLRPDFLAGMLEQLVRSGALSRLYTGTTIKHLPKRSLATVTIPVPSLRRQDDIVAKVAEATVAEQRFTASRVVAQQRSEALRRALLTAAFTGRLTGRSSDMDVAEELAEVAS